MQTLNINTKTTKIFCLLVFIFVGLSTIAQKDSISKNRLSINLAAGVISGEVGLYYDYRVSDKLAFQLSYGHRFYNFNIIMNGGRGSGYKYFPQQGNIFRIALKKYLKIKHETKLRSTYLTYRLSYWELHTPKYTNRYGSNGLNTILREVVSIDKNVFNIAFGIGKEINFKNSLFVDMFYSVGVSVGEKKINKYSYGNNGSGDSFLYPPNTHVKMLSLFPTIEIGFKVGFKW